MPCGGLEWDRGHESFVAVVRAESSSGLVVSQVHDHSILGGLRWIRADEVISSEELPIDSPAVRLAAHRGDLSASVDGSLTDLATLLELLAGLTEPVAVCRERTGSDELLVGANARVVGGRLALI